MNLQNFKNKKYYITELELKGFKGTKSINTFEDTFKLNIDTNLEDKDIVLIYAENGKGKSTLLENLHPYPYMISREIKKSITYPAHKKITFKNKETEIKCEIYWNSETETKGYIYINGEKIINTEKGNITEYNYVVNYLFLEFNKFKTSLFMQQDTLEIVKAKPSERAKIINNFSNSTISFNDIKEKVTEEINKITEKIKIYNKEIEEYKAYENRYEQLQKFNKEEKEEELKLKSLILKEKEEELKEEEQKKIKNDLYLKDLLSKEKEEQLINITRIENSLNETKESLLSLKTKTYDNNIVEKTKKIEELSKEIEELSLYEIKIFELPVNIEEREIIKEEEYNEIIKIIENFNYIKMLKEELKKKEKQIIQIKTEIEVEQKQQKKINVEIVKNLSEDSIKEEKYKEYKRKENYINKNQELKELNKEKFPNKEEIEKKLEKIRNLKVKSSEEEKSLKELKHILSNIKKTENDNFKCKCCNSVLNKKQLETHKKELETKLETIKTELSSLETEEELNNILKKIEKHKYKIQLLETEISKECFDENLYEEKIIDLDKKLKLIEEYKEYQKTEEKINLLNENLNKIIKEKNDLLEKYKEYKSYETNKTLEELKGMKFLYESKEEYLKISKILLEKFNITKTKTILEDIKRIIKEKQEEKEIEQKVINEYQITLEKINTLNKNKIDLENKKEKHIQLKKEIASIKEKIEKNNFEDSIFEKLKEYVQSLKKQVEELQKEFTTYQSDFKYINELMEKYLEKTKILEELKKEEYSYKKIKIYNDRIKKAQISNFFAGITDTINEIISTEEGTLSNLRVSITQKGNKNLNIETQTETNTVEDISLLSGAEKSVVAKGISLALAKENNFGIVYMDESDGKLSKKNKEQFFQTLEKTKMLINTNQLFVISHNEDLLLLADKIIEF